MTDKEWVEKDNPAWIAWDLLGRPPENEEYFQMWADYCRKEILMNKVELRCPKCGALWDDSTFFGTRRTIRYRQGPYYHSDYKIDEYLEKTCWQCEYVTIEPCRDAEKQKTEITSCDHMYWNPHVYVDCPSLELFSDLFNEVKKIEKSRFCRRCGKKEESQIPKCEHVYNAVKLIERSNFCVKCGEKLE